MARFFHVTNTDNLELRCVGFKKKLEEKYIQKVCSLFKMDAVMLGLRDQTLYKRQRVISLLNYVLYVAQRCC